ncbi:MAG: DNA cytosine methyltransferase [Rubrobacteraceae bacterium]
MKGGEFRAVDLFCGCGGISSGLRAAGFEIISGVDIDAVPLRSFGVNFPHARGLRLDLSVTEPGSLMRKLNLKRGELDLLAGGPPCQGFSKNVPRSRRFLDDPQNLLVKTFLDYCAALMPRMIFMENVAEMKNGFKRAYTEELFERLDKIGYFVSHKNLYASDFGVPQRRRRAFFIAARDHAAEPEFPAGSHVKPEPPETNSLKLLLSKEHVNVWDAIGDLPSLAHGEGEEPVGYSAEPFSDFQRIVRNGRADVSNHIARKLRPTQYERLASIKPGEGMKDLPEHLRPKSGYSGAYGRLSKSMIAPTITRWVFHPGSGRFGHPVDTRVITIREAARLQAFPDSFVFTGTYTQQSHQVGNAVPPLLAEQVAASLLAQFS